ncbi:dTDP-4-dehydrorhamnose 3,5-epimerase family protein [Flavobacterium antarcticum]|uniref:dTDP-4-dehydrorhamnose 3,5-epimerase family protein n=1 Tax=Flavobacterium antarcticum TaxID=271155 RepID=UPI0003B5D3C2|nr:dTDP-4-dehydrorhamnose 3,5-epimerase family protein [Flavobacterium antarcticum]
MNAKPFLIEGAVFTDDRGSVSFVNDFNFANIERFYIIKNAEKNPVRAWQGHKLDSKNFYCISGSFEIYYVKIDNWENPSHDLKVESVILRASQANILHIPSGYANGIKALEKESQLMSFSTLPLNLYKEDDVRYDCSTWKIDTE